MNFDATFPYDPSHPKGREQLERAIQRTIDVDMPSKVDGGCWMELAFQCEKLHWLAHRLHMADKMAEMRAFCPPVGDREAR